MQNLPMEVAEIVPTDDDYEKDPELMAVVDHFAIAELGKALDGARNSNDPSYQRLRSAATEICRRAGILDVLKAVSADGALRPPPPWPQADIVPVGGGPGYVICAIRTMYQGLVADTRERIKVGKKKKPTQDQIGEAFDRGYFRLRKQINKGAKR